MGTNTATDADARAAGVSIFDAAEEGLPVPRMNRSGWPQARLRSLYQKSHDR